MRKILQSLSENRIVLGMILTLIAFYSFTVSFRIYPSTGIIGHDREVFRYIGMVISEGGFPYKDAFDHKPPLIYLFSALTHRYGQSYFWMLETVLAGLAAIAVFFAASKRQWPLPLLFPFYLIALLRFPDFFGNGGLTRGFSSYFITFAIVAVFSSHKWKYFFFGCFVSAVFFLQQNDAPALFFPFFWALIHENGRGKISALMKSAAGSLFVLVPLFSWILLNGFFHEFIRDAFLFNTQVYAFGLSKWEILKLTVETIKLHYFKPWLLLLGGILLLARSQYRIGEKSFWTDLCRSPLTYLLSGFFVQMYLLNITGVRFEHYFLSVCPWLIMISGETLRAVKLSWNTQVPSRFFWLLSLLLCSSLPTLGIGRAFDGGFRVWKNYSRPVDILSQALRTRLENVRGKRGQFFIFSNTPMLYANTEYNIIAPTRWAYHSFWQQIPEHIWDPGQEKLSEIISGLESYKTRFILDFSSPETIPSESARRHWQEFRDKNYKLIDHTHGGSLYERVIPTEEKR